MTEPYMPEDESRRVCAVCARGLHRFVDTLTGDMEYIHPFDMELAETDDHIPVPVLPSEISMDTRCDFCFWRDPQWVIPAKSFEYATWQKIGMPIRGESIGSWGACDVCADFVNRGLWSNLQRRSIEAHRQLTAEMELGPDHTDKEATEFVAAYTRTLFRQLRKNILGPPRHL